MFLLKNWKIIIFIALITAAGSLYLSQKNEILNLKETNADLENRERILSDQVTALQEQITQNEKALSFIEEQHNENRKAEKHYQKRVITNRRVVKKAKKEESFDKIFERIDTYFSGSIADRLSNERKNTNKVQSPDNRVLRAREASF